MGQSRQHQWYWLGIMSATLLAVGCEPISSAPHEATVRSPSPAPDRPSATDAKLASVLGPFRDWVLDQKTGPDGKPLFSRVEILPVVLTVLPYGVGTNQQEPRLPVIVTTGPGWAELRSSQKEKQISLVYQELVNRSRQSSSGPRPTLTLQTPQGIVISWINDITEGQKLIYGDDG